MNQQCRFQFKRNIALGRSLLELMISIAIGLIVIAAALAVYSASTGTSRVSESESRLNENAAITIGILQQQIRLASYSSVVGSTTYVVRKNFDGPGVGSCTGGFSGTATVAFASIACANDTTKPDSLIVRYEADTANTIPVSTPAVPSSCTGETITSTRPSDATSTAVGAVALANYSLADNRYYVATGPSGGPELYCVGATGVNVAGSTTFGTPQPLMEGVESMQLTFGVAGTTTGTITTAYMSAQDINTTFSTESDRWKRVLTVRVCLLMRNLESSDKFKKAAISTTSSYYDCNNAAQTSTDGYLRRAYTSTVLLKNRIPI